MPSASWNTKLSILWLIQAVNAIAIVDISRIENVEGLIAFEDSSGVLAVSLAICCILAWLSAIFPARIARWPSLAFGLIFAFLKVWALITPYSLGLGDQLYASWIFNELIGLLLVIPIVWYAIKVPKTRTQS